MPCPNKILSVRRMIGFWETEESSSGAHPSGARRKSRNAELSPRSSLLPPDIFCFARVRVRVVCALMSVKCFSFCEGVKRQRTTFAYRTTFDGNRGVCIIYYFKALQTKAKLTRRLSALTSLATSSCTSNSANRRRRCRISTFLKTGRFRKRLKR